MSDIYVKIVYSTSYCKILTTIDKVANWIGLFILVIFGECTGTYIALVMYWKML